MSRPPAGSNYKSSLNLDKMNSFKKPENPKIWVEISKKNLLHNINEISKNLNPKTRFMVALKSNAYGHGLSEIAKIILQATSYKPQAELWFGIDSLTEALELQKIKNANKIPTLVLGYAPLASLKNVPENVRLTVYNFETVGALGGINKKFKVHIKVETGTNRQGVPLGDIEKFIKEIKKYKNIEVEGISSHFAEAENISSKFTKKQLKIFNNAIGIAEQLLNKKLIKHIACSAAMSHLPQSHFNMVRAGINLYGLHSVISPRSEILNKFKILNLRPVLSWKTVVAQVKNVKDGESIGYGQSAKMPYNGQIAVLPIGYFDGHDRGLSNIGEVLIRGQKCKIIGRVCMNMCMALLPKNLKIQLEDEVVLIGKQGQKEIAADEIAQKLGTINYEVVARINPLIPRVIS